MSSEVETSLTSSRSISAGALCISGSIANTDSVVVSSGASLCLNGGAIGSAGTVTTLASGAFLNGSGTINGTFNNNGSVDLGSGQTLVLTGDVTNHGTMTFSRGGTLDASGATSFVNNGTIDYISGSASFPANFSNGVVVDSSAVEVEAVSKAASVVTLTIRSYPGHTYPLQRTTALGATVLENIGDAQSGDGSVLTFTDSNAPSHAGFYRIIIDP